MDYRRRCDRISQRRGKWSAFITEDNNGDFWFNTENRYSVYDSMTLKSNKFYSRHESIGSLDGKNTSGLKEYLSIARDNDNHLWFVTYRSGVWKYVLHQGEILLEEFLIPMEISAYCLAK